MFFSSCRPAKTNSRFFKLCRAERSSSGPRFLVEETKTYRFQGTNCSYPTFGNGKSFDSKSVLKTGMLVPRRVLFSCWLDGTSTKGYSWKEKEKVVLQT